MRDAEWEALAHAVGFQSAAGRLAQPRPVPYRNATAPRPLPRRMRPADVRANDPQLAQSERDIARRELQRGDTLGRLADMGAAQSAPDPIHTPLQSNTLALGRALGPGNAYDAVTSGARLAGGDQSALGDFALSTTYAALPFLGARGMRGEPAPAPMREPPTPRAATGPMVNDLDQWIQGGMPNTRREMLPDLIRRQQVLNMESGPSHDMESLIRMARSSPDTFADNLSADLGSFGVGGSLEHMPLLGSPDIAADPLANPTRPGLPRTGATPGFMQAPNEDRYLFGRRPYTRTNAEDGFATYDFRANGRPYRVRMAAEDPENPSQVTVDFGPLGADESMSAVPTGDMRPADALRTMRTVTGILRDDAQTFRRGGYHWAGSPEHASLYDTMLSRYGAPEGYQVQRDPYGGASLQRAPAEAPRPNGPPQAAFGTRGARSGLRAAVRDPQTGQVYTGANHFFALENAPPEAQGRIIDGGGFADESGAYLTREEAAQRLGITHRSRADAGDLERPQASPDASHARPVQASDGNAASGRTVYRALQSPDQESPNPWWSASPQTANSYIAHSGEGATMQRRQITQADLGNNLELDLRGRRIDRMNLWEIPNAELRRRIQQRYGSLTTANGIQNDLIAEEARKMGFDSVTFRNARDPAEGVGGEPDDIFVILNEPRQSPNANAPPPPDRTPKSLPRRKPPQGGFFMPRGNP